MAEEEGKLRLCAFCTEETIIGVPCKRIYLYFQAIAASNAECNLDTLLLFNLLPELILEV